MSHAALGPYAAELIETARAIAAPGKGILAADESTGTIGSRFKAINVENNEENRRKYRQLLFKTEGIEEHISGVILFEETLYQKADDGTDFVEILKQKNMIPGIKVGFNRSPSVFGSYSQHIFSCIYCVGRQGC